MLICKQGNNTKYQMHRYFSRSTDYHISSAGTLFYHPLNHSQELCTSLEFEEHMVMRLIAGSYPFFL